MANQEICEKIKGMLVENLRIPADELEFDSELFTISVWIPLIPSR